MTGDVREKIAKNRTVPKTVEQIRTERQRANKAKPNQPTRGRGGGAKTRGAKNPPRTKEEPVKQPKAPR